MSTLVLDRVTTSDNNAWYRQVAAGWARRLMTGDSPEAWATHTDRDMQFAVSHLRLRAGDRVLDLGCGWGRHSLPLAAYGLQVTGIDLSHDLLALARYNARRQQLKVNWIEADVAHPPLSGVFDAIVQFYGNFTTWFSCDELSIDALWNVAHLLRPGGRLLLGTDDWQSELPSRSQHYDEWPGGAAIYRQRYDEQRRVAETQTVIFGPEHERHEYRRQTWWPTMYEMEMMFEQVGLRLCGRYNAFRDAPFNPDGSGLVYVLERQG